MVKHWKSGNLDTAVAGGYVWLIVNNSDGGVHYVHQSFTQDKVLLLQL
jgi:hypothetical protein